MAAPSKYDVNTDLVLADDLFLYIKDTGSTDQVLAFCTSCSLEISGETLDTSNKMSGRWNSNLSGKSGYTISSDALYTQLEGAISFDSLMAKMVENGKCEWTIGKCTAESVTFELDKSKPYYTGTAFITSLSLNAENNNVANCSISLTGSGEIKLNQPAA